MTRKYAQQLLRQLLANPEEALEKAIYWRPQVFELFRRRLDDLLIEEPARALELARIAPELAERTCTANSEVSRSTLRAQAYASLGSAHRALGELEKSEQAYSIALEEEDHLPPLEKADLYRRVAYLHLVQHNEEALPMIDEAIRIHRLETDLVDRHELGACLVARAHVSKIVFAKHGQAIVELTAALNHISLKKDPKLYYAAIHNLASTLLDCGSPEELNTALEYLEPALASLSGFKTKHFAKYKLRWLQALIHARFGQTARPELLYREAREGLIDLGSPYEAAMVSTDLALLYLATGRSRELGDLAAETHREFRQMGADADANHAFKLWQHAVLQEQVNFDSLKNVRVSLAKSTPIRLVSE